jgi:hypothetical protein
MWRRLAALLVLWPAVSMADPIAIYKLEIPGNRFPSYHIAQRSTWGDAAAATRSACEDKSTKDDTCHMLAKVDARCVSLWQTDTREPDGSSTQGIGYGEDRETVKGVVQRGCEIKGPCHGVRTVCSP